MMSLEKAWEPFFYLQSEHIPSKWDNTHSDMQVLAEIKKSHYNDLN